MATRKKKKIFRKVLMFFIVFAGMGLAAWWWYRLHATNFVTYPEFGIAVPANYAIHGIDVSHHQENINWDLVKNMQVQNIKIGFVFIKATEGIGRVDSHFNQNWFRSKDAGMCRGAYHFFLATKSGKLQAQNFIDVVTLKPGDLPPVLDVEQTYGVPVDKLRKEVKAFLQTTEQYYGVKPIIYTNVDFYKNNLGSEFDKYPLWVAHYYEEQQPRITRDWAFWQHNDQGNINGITSKVDFNVFKGDSVQLKEMQVR